MSVSEQYEWEYRLEPDGGRFSGWHWSVGHVGSLSHWTGYTLSKRGAKRAMNKVVRREQYRRALAEKWRR